MTKEIVDSEYEAESLPLSPEAGQSVDDLTEMRDTTAGSRVANMSTKAKLVPFGLDESVCGEDKDSNERLHRFVATEDESKELTTEANAEAAARLGDDEENEDLF